MVTRYTKDGFAYGAPPYTEEEQRAYIEAMSAGPVAIARSPQEREQGPQLSRPEEQVARP